MHKEVLKKGTEMRVLIKLFLAGLVVQVSIMLEAYNWKPVGDLVIDRYAYNNGTPSPVYADGDRLTDTTYMRYDGGTRKGLRARQLSNLLTRKIEQRKHHQHSPDNRCCDGGSWDNYLVDKDQLKSPTPGDNQGFNATPSDSVLYVYGTLNGDPGAAQCPLKIDGDIVLSAITTDMLVKLMTDVTIEPYLDPTSPTHDGLGGTHTGKPYSHLQFYAEVGKKITVEVNHDLTFRGITIGTPGPGAVPDDLIVTFVGRGQTIFQLVDGTAVKFEGDIDETQRVSLLGAAACSYSLPGVSYNAAGTKVYIAMDQTQQDIDLGINKVVFQRKKYTFEDNRVLVAIGPNSIITFVSSDPTGLAHVANPDIGGFGALAFDVSNMGTGRMVLYISGTKQFGWQLLDSGGHQLYTSTNPLFYKIASVAPFNDGALVVAGHRVASYSVADMRSTINYSVPAGGRAYCSIIDNVAYARRPNPSTYDPDIRGLLVINDVDTVSKLAADPYLDYYRTSAGSGIDRSHELLDDGDEYEDDDEEEYGESEVLDELLEEHNLPIIAPKKLNAQHDERLSLRERMDKIRQNKDKELFRDVAMRPSTPVYGHDWSYSSGVLEPGEWLKNRRFGCIVGVNGSLRINDRTFMDYVAGSINGMDWLAQNDLQNFDGAGGQSCSILKKRNPSALIFDGLDVGLFLDRPTPVSQFEAANPLTQVNPVHAQVELYGSAGISMRQCADSALGYIPNFWQVASRGTRAADLLRAYSKTADKRLQSSLAIADLLKEQGNAFEGFTSRDSSMRTLGISPLDVPDLDFQSSLILASSQYDGYNLAVAAGTMSGGATSMAGDNVVEVQGHTTIHSLLNTRVVDSETGLDRVYTTTVSNAGYVVTPTLAIDASGDEVGNPRPLVAAGTSYQRYNSPVLFFNDHLDLVGTTLVHSDATKLVSGLPTQSYPAIVGGERFVVADAISTYDANDRDRFRIPEIRLYGSGIDLEESLNMAGVRLVVRNDPLYDQVLGINDSVIRFFDHGNARDMNVTGHGRIFMLGSQRNTAANGSTTSWITESAFVNVFNYTEQIVGADPQSVTLSLQNGNQYPSSVSPTLYDSQRASHLILFSSLPRGTANIAMGWPTISGYSDNSLPYANTRYGNMVYAEAAGSLPFSNDAMITPAATLSIDAQYISLSGFDQAGNGTVKPLNTLHDNALYVNHGGKVTITRPTLLTSIPYRLTLDAMIAQKVWPDFDITANTQQTILSGIVDLPHDQTVFCPGSAVQPVGLAQAMTAGTRGFIRINYFNPYRTRHADQSGAAEVMINLSSLDTRDSSIRKAPLSRAYAWAPNQRSVPFRAIQNVETPTLRPSSLIAVGPSDFINQLGVAGATVGAPLLLDVAGGRVREIVSTPVTFDQGVDWHSSLQLGTLDQGAHAIIYLEQQGRCGLGSMGWNSRSVNAFNVLGETCVQIAPLDDGIIDVNSNLICYDNLPLQALTSFGATHVNRLTFTAENEREIRILKGNELDLSAFGQNVKQQQIMFDGKVKLVVEAGAKIRFPENPIGGIVLYFNGDSKLVFEAPQTPVLYPDLIVTSTDTDVLRTKIIGCGEIWANKNAQIHIDEGALVGVQADVRTPTTNVAVSLNRDAQWYLGTKQLAGGAFEVGNPENVAGASISFTLKLMHPDCLFHIDREGFFGLGVGVIRKNKNPNGKALQSNNPQVNAQGKAVTNSYGDPIFNSHAEAWKVQALKNVSSITLQLEAGTFSHNNIADGSSPEASLVAVGPSTAYAFNVLKDASLLAIKGGGNVMTVPSGTSGFVNIWDYASQFYSGVQYGLMTVLPVLLEKFINSGATSLGSDLWSLNPTSQASFYSMLAMPLFSTSSAKYAACQVSSWYPIAGFVNKDIKNKKYASTQNIMTRLSNIELSHGEMQAVMLDGFVDCSDSSAFGGARFGAS